MAVQAMSAGQLHPNTTRRNLYGRRYGKALKPNQRVALRQELPGLQVPDVERDENPGRKPLDPASLFGGRPIWLEIGFGAGEHLVHQAAQHPDTGFIGCETFVNGIAMLLGKIRMTGVNNVLIHPGDARDLLDVLPDGSVSRTFLLYPDPWPKKRHHRRRAVTSEYLIPLADVMVPGAELRVATDIPDYVRQALEEVPKAGFAWQAERPSDWRCPWKDWLSTRYEQKALREGRTPHYLTFTKCF